jgi:hypothetical protein
MMSKPEIIKRRSNAAMAKAAEVFLFYFDKSDYIGVDEGLEMIKRADGLYFGH